MCIAFLYVNGSSQSSLICVKFCYTASLRRDALLCITLMNVHKHSLHEPRTKSPRTRHEERDLVEERRDTEDPVSYTSQSHEMMNIPVSLSSSRNRIPDVYSHQCLYKQELCSSSFHSFCHACFIKHPMRLTFDGLTAFVPPLPTFRLEPCAQRNTRQANKRTVQTSLPQKPLAYCTLLHSPARPTLCGPRGPLIQFCSPSPVPRLHVTKIRL